VKSRFDTPQFFPFPPLSPLAFFVSCSIALSEATFSLCSKVFVALSTIVAGPFLEEDSV
jgi:hypothetical protein